MKVQTDNPSHDIEEKSIEPSEDRIYLSKKDDYFV